MERDRLTAFTDGVLAIIVTIMVLELRPPEGAAFADLFALCPKFLGYLLSFVYIAIYWNNHHHMFQAVQKVTGGALWANMHLLFWISLIPFVTDWMGERFAAIPVATYGVVLMSAGAAYFILSRVLLASAGPTSLLARALGRDVKGIASLVIYALAVAVALFAPWLACALYVVVALLWLVPDQRIERLLG